MSHDQTEFSTACVVPSPAIAVREIHTIGLLTISQRQNTCDQYNVAHSKVHPSTTNRWTKRHTLIASSMAAWRDRGGVVFFIFTSTRSFFIVISAQCGNPNRVRAIQNHFSVNTHILKHVSDNVMGAQASWAHMVNGKAHCCSNVIQSIDKYGAHELGVVLLTGPLRQAKHVAPYWLRAPHGWRATNNEVANRSQSQSQTNTTRVKVAKKYRRLSLTIAKARQQWSFLGSKQRCVGISRMPKNVIATRKPQEMLNKCS